MKVLSQIPSYYLFRLAGRPRKLPINLTLSLTFKCNSRCKTCNVYKKRSQELSLQEWKPIFESLGQNPFWVTISGGEPFLRTDIAEIVSSLYDICHPAIVNIPSNGLLSDRIFEVVKQIAEHCRDTQIVINLSIDEIGTKHDDLRGVPGNYAKALKTFFKLKELEMQNISIGLHTVISRFNVNRIPQIYGTLRAYNADSYITEIAEERVELNTVNSGITPDYEDYVKAVDFLALELKRDSFSRIGKITRAFRIEYYEMVKKILSEKRQIIPCFAGFASAQIAPDGDVWMCCVKAESIGNLKDTDYNFKQVWFSEKANKLRKSIKNGECYCPLANASYTNMLHDLKSLSRVGWNYIRIYYS
ncbi:MAG: radical SAM protein [Candidatus Aenigmarchaeota archaeon]|nr:radical SAM protein [Candidatus Aenigmarchaeota archaeon]